MFNNSGRAGRMAPKPPYRGLPVRVGPYLNQVLAGGVLYLKTSDLDRCDLLVPLTGCEQLDFRGLYFLDSAFQPSGITQFKPGRKYAVLCAKLPECGGMPVDWEDLLRSEILPRLAAGVKMMPFCLTGEGRTGTFLASLAALLEPDVDDPIQAVRERYCVHAVETVRQAEAVFAIKGKPLPEKYRQSLAP
ncbi:MAG: hypothetical protein IT342_25605 [Candidatus Melainabacteria bacterium]|nr:hypothetical protein [Candidatus Melainabacteria bacterium]